MSKMISAKVRIASTNTLLPVATQSAIATAHNILPPSLIRAAEVLRPPKFAFSSVAKQDKEHTSTTEASSSNIPTKTEPVSKPAFSIQHRPFESLFDHLWRTTTSGLPFDRFSHAPGMQMQIRQLIQDMNDITQSRMDRWMLSGVPRFNLDQLGPSLDVWKNAKYEEATKQYELPFHVPNIFQDGDVSCSIVKDKTTGSYMLHIHGQREVESTLDEKILPGAPDNADTEATPSEENEKISEPKTTSKSDYKYDMQFQLPPLPTDMTFEQAQEYYSPITAHFNATEGLLRVKIPESIMSPGSEESETVKDEYRFSVPIQSAA